MPTILRVMGTLWIIHTRDHGFPHVTVYTGSPENREAVAKIRLDIIEVIESKGFSRKFFNKILEQTRNYQELRLETWNEIHEEEN